MHSGINNRLNNFTMKTKVYILLLFFFALPVTFYCQIEKVIVETYYVSDQSDVADTTSGKLEEGSVTYRIYVDLKPGNKLLKIYGDANHALKFASTKPFFNNVDGETYGNDLKKGLYGDNTVALDTWLTLGQTTKTQAGKTHFGILKAEDTNGSFIGGANNSGGLLTNTAATIGVPLTTADGMDTMVTLPSSWSYFGIKDFLTGLDSTMFGSNISKSEFNSNNVFLKNLGVTGVVPTVNQILIAQLTTKGQLSFELNLEVEQIINGVLTVVRYVADDNILLPAEKKSSFLKFPFPQATCGCMDAGFLEYDPNLKCAENSVYCRNRIVFGCTDTMACNFEPNANFNIPSLCCYPGSCGGRDISVVCPSIRGNSFDFEIYPNPAENNIFLNVTSGIKQQINYSIFNCFGTLVLSKDFGESEKISNYEIDLSDLNNSLYLIRVNAGNNFSSKQFLKNQK